MEITLINKQKRLTGFTLIELLIVIFVLGVGILSIVVLINNNLSLSGKVHNQNTATVLAREAMEMLYNYRDTNNLLGYEWNCAERLDENEITSDSSCKSYFWTGGSEKNYFTIDGAHKDFNQVELKKISPDNESFKALQDKSKLYFGNLGDSHSGYSHDKNIGTEAGFSRYILFTEMNALKDPLSKNDIHHVEVHVLYSYGSKTGDVILESFIANPN